MKTIVILILLHSYLFSCVLEDADSDYRIVVNSQDSIKITSTELGYIYTGKIRNWPSGMKITVFVRPFNDHQQKGMSLEILGISLTSFRESATKNKHIRIADRNKILLHVTRTPGGLGMISETAGYMNSDDGVIMLEITDG